VNVRTSMSKAQLENLARDKIERIADSDSSWLRDVAADVHNVEVGIWRCVQGGESRCCAGLDCDCGECCENGALWESPLDWEPECGWCGRKALLVEIVGLFDYAPSHDERG
jgi:hypothetical protein